MTIDEVDFCVTTFKRPGAVAELLRSIADRYPTAAVYVADQNEGVDHEFYDGLWGELSERGLLSRPAVSDLDFDCGLSAARNHLVTTTSGKYKLILDDDFVFAEDTTIEKLVELLEEHPAAGVVGGVVTRNGEPVPFDFRIEKTGGGPSASFLMMAHTFAVDRGSAFARPTAW